jgi:hypothetical protein
MKSRRLVDSLCAILRSFISFSVRKKTKGRSIAGFPQMNALVPAATAVGRELARSYAIDVPRRVVRALTKSKHGLEPFLRPRRTQRHRLHRTVAVQQNPVSH